MNYRWIPKVGCMFWIERQNCQKKLNFHTTSFRIWSCTARMNCLEASHFAILEVQRSTCLPHIQGIKANQPSNLTRHSDVTQKFRSHLGVEICFRLLHLGQGWNSLEKISFCFIFPDFIAAKWRWNVQKTQIFGMFVTKVQWTAVCLGSLWTISNHRGPSTTGGPTSPFLKLPGAWKARHFIVVACPCNTQLVSLQL